MPSARVSLREAEVVKMVLEFLENRRLHISQLSLERETGVINGRHSDDMLFLRQLILDGQWDDVLEFVQPLEGIDGFNSRRFKYIVCRHKYEELLCIRSEVMNSQAVDVAVDEMVKCLDDMEKLAPSKDEYSALCLLLTQPRLTDHPDYRDWNPSSARVHCFAAVFPLVEKYLPPPPTPASNKTGKSHQFATAKNDRLVQLIIKGALYESCVEFCQQKATREGSGGGSDGVVGKGGVHDQIQFSGMLDNDGSKGFTDADLSLPSWLQSIPNDIFGCPFEQRTLNVDVEALQRPSLEASWTEHILVTPIKPRTFPHSAMPASRPMSGTAAAAAAGLMSRSLNPQLDGLPFGLAASQRHHLMALSVGDMSSMSKSFAGFHLTGKKSMNTSVDRLFEDLDDVDDTVPSSATTPTNDDYGGLPAVLGGKVAAAVAGFSKPPPPPSSDDVADQVRAPFSTNGNGSGVKPASKAEDDGRREQVVAIRNKGNKDDEHDREHSTATNVGRSSDSPELYKEYRRQKLKNQEAEERKRDEYFRQQQPTSMIEGGGGGGRQPIVGDNRLREECGGGGESEPSTHFRVGGGGHLSKANAGYLDPLCSSTPKLSLCPTRESPSSSYTTLKMNPSKNPAQDQILRPDASDTISMTTTTSGQPLNQPQQQQQFIRHQDHLQPKAKHGYVSPNRAAANGTNSTTPPRTQPQRALGSKPRFIPVTSLEDVQAIRAAEFHPSGDLYAIGSNSKTLRVCAYPKMNDLTEGHITHQPTVLFKRTKHHKGSIYCLAWNATGDLLATGSNDKTVRLMRFNRETCNVDGDDVELTMHDGTVRDVCFVEDLSNKSSLLISGGAGDCKIYVTDCVTGTPFQALSGHSGHILSLYTWGGAMFVSGSQDRTIRFWDLRTHGCVNVIPSPPPSGGSGAIKGAAVAAVAVDPSGRMLVSGQEDASCMLYDIRGNRIIQCFKPHTADIRTIRFSPKAYYLLSGSYDNKVILTDLQGDLTQPLPSLVVSEHQDKVIQCRWHPTDFAYLSTSADKTATLWGLPPN